MVLEAPLKLLLISLQWLFWIYVLLSGTLTIRQSLNWFSQITYHFYDRIIQFMNWIMRDNNWNFLSRFRGFHSRLIKHLRAIMTALKVCFGVILKVYHWLLLRVQSISKTISIDIMRSFESEVLVIGLIKIVVNIVHFKDWVLVYLLRCISVKWGRLRMKFCLHLCNNIATTIRSDLSFHVEIRVLHRNHWILSFLLICLFVTLKLFLT